MGKSKRKNNWKDKRQQTKKKQNTTQDDYYSNDRFVMENKSFEAYYKVRQKIRLDLIKYFSSA